MKHLRIFILVLLALVLPVRGAVAAAMLCPEGVGTGVVALVAEHGHQDRQVDEVVSHHHGMDSTIDDSSLGEHVSTCQFCPSGCCTASMVGTVASSGQPSLNSSVSYPALTVPSPAFQAGGQDRPPRTF